MNRWPGIRRVSTGAPWLRPRKLLHGALVQEHPGHDVGEPGQPRGREVGVVALVLAGERDVQAVVDVVGPLRVQAVAAAVA
jgi:hypothetical protein